MLGHRKNKPMPHPPQAEAVSPHAVRPDAGRSSGVSRRTLGMALVQNGTITEEQLSEALEVQERRGGFVGQILVDLGHITQDDIVTFLVKECKIPHLNLEGYEVSNELIDFIPREVCIEHKLLPIDMLGKILTVAMVDPLDDAAVGAVEQYCPEYRIKPILCSWQHFCSVSQRLFGERAGSTREVTADSLGLNGMASSAPRKAEPRAEVDQDPEMDAAVDRLVAEAGGAKESEKTAQASAKQGAAPARPVEAVDAPSADPKSAGGNAAGSRTAGPGPEPRGVQDVGTPSRDALAQRTQSLMQGAMRSALAGHEAPSGTAKPPLPLEDYGEAAAVAEAEMRDLIEADRRRRKGEHASVKPFRAGAGSLGGDSAEQDRRVLDGLGSEKPLGVFSFDTFYAGKANALTFKLSEAVAMTPGGEYNPFFLYGNVGLGKTHLINAIGNAICDHFPDRRVGYVSASHFAQRLSEAVQHRALDLFRENYCHWDVLILDDIQFLGGRVEAQEEFFHIFNALHRDRRQIIIASDKAPLKLGLLQERLISRFASGIVAELKAPDMETRLVILRHYMDQREVSIPGDIVSLVAVRVPHDVRMMVGAMQKIIAYEKLIEGDITYELASDILSHLGAVEAA